MFGFRIEAAKNSGSGAERVAGGSDAMAGNAGELVIRISWFMSGLIP